MISNFVLIDI